MEFWNTVKGWMKNLWSGGGNFISKYDMFQDIGKPVIQRVFGIGRSKASPGAEGGSSADKPIEVNSWGPQDEEGILYLLAKYGIPPEAMKEGLEPIKLTADESRAVGLLVGRMTPGEADAFKRIIARGNEQAITIKVPVPIEIKKKNPKTDDVISVTEEKGFREYTIFAAIRGSHILRCIGQDIFKAGTQAQQEEQAVRLVEEFRQVGILKNWPDLARKAWDKLDDFGFLRKVNPSLWHDLNRIANCLGGWTPVRTMLNEKDGQHYWQAFLKAKPDEVDQKRTDLINFLSRTAMYILGRPAEEQVRYWGIKPSRKWHKIVFIILVWVAIFALIWAMYPTHPV